MIDETRKAVIIQKAKVLNSKVEDGELLDLIVNSVIGRILLYLNTQEVDGRLDNVIAQVVANIYAKALNTSTTGQPEPGIASVSDNGQSVHFSNDPKQYLATAGDEELFSGFEKLLKPYRRVHVIP